MTTRPGSGVSRGWKWSWHENPTKLDLSDIHEKELILNFDAEKKNVESAAKEATMNMNEWKEVKKAIEEKEKESPCFACGHREVCNRSADCARYRHNVEDAINPWPDTFNAKITCKYRFTIEDIVIGLRVIEKKMSTGDTIPKELEELYDVVEAMRKSRRI